MGYVRPFAEADIPLVARLHQAVFERGHRVLRAGKRREAHDAYFRDVFLRGPSQDPALPSLVYQEDNGRIAGFLGVMPRRVTMNGHQFRAAISSQFIAAPESRVAMVAVRLAKAFLEGPQDLSISDEANDTAKRIWERLGGTASLLHSLHWTRLLRPARFVLSLMRNRPRVSILAAAAGPLAPFIDAAATRMPNSHLYQTKPGVSAVDDLTEQTILAYLPAFVRSGALRVDYDERTLRWVLERARQRRADDTFRAAVIRNNQRIIGWYLFHVDASRIAHVLQIVADPAAIGDVLDHLFYQAAEQGAAAATGRLEPRFMQALSDKDRVLHREGPGSLLECTTLGTPPSIRKRRGGVLPPRRRMVSRFLGGWSAVAADRDRSINERPRAVAAARASDERQATMQARVRQSRRRSICAASLIVISTLAGLSPPEATAQLGSLVVAVTAPTSGAKVRGTVPFAAQVTIVGGLTVQSVEFRVDGVPIGVDTTAPYSVPWNTTTASNGPHNLTARARDLLGVVWDSAVVSVTVDNTRPTVSINQATGQADPTNAAPLRFTVVFSETGDWFYERRRHDHRHCRRHQDGRPERWSQHVQRGGERHDHRHGDRLDPGRRGE